MSSKILRIWGSRTLGVLGGLLVSSFVTISVTKVQTFVGFIIAALSTEIWQLCVGFGVAGLGYNFGLISSSEAVMNWFFDKRPLALSIGMTGISVFCIAFPVCSFKSEPINNSRSATISSVECEIQCKRCTAHLRRHNFSLVHWRFATQTCPG